MKTILLTVTICLITFWSCTSDKGTQSPQYLAEIVGYDLNCSTCILSFPDDLEAVQKEIGPSTQNYYHAVNLDKDQFIIGQQLKVTIRKAETDELPACITQYPTYDYKNIFILNFEAVNLFKLNDTLEIPYKTSFTNQENQLTIYFDSVIEDSRCPLNMLCYWAGNAVVSFEVTFQENCNDSIVLNTFYDFRNDTVINGFRFNLIGLKPYPENDNPIPQNEYIAVIKVTKE